MARVINPIKFGTDGWRGVIAAEFTFDRVAMLAPLAAQVLVNNFGETVKRPQTVVVGYDRRFMAEDFARTAAEALQAAGFDVLLSESYAPTPAFSWAAYSLGVLGAIVLTASHNPANYLGLKVKGAFGGSVAPDITKQIEALIPNPPTFSADPGTITLFDPWGSYCDELRGKVDIANIRDAIVSGKLEVFADVMHGAAATGLSRILGCDITEINSERDPLFEGGAPEPLPKYLAKLFKAVKTATKNNPDALRVGLVFDGDSDRIAATDRDGNFLSSQVLIPILIKHLSQNRGFTGEIVKTVSGSDLIPKLAEKMGLDLSETPIGYKYIADRMLGSQVLIGGEESGGVGYGNHIPERDALLSALYVLEAIATSAQDLSELYQAAQTEADFFSAYDRIDFPLANMDVRAKLLASLQTDLPATIAGKKVVNCLQTDGYKFRLENNDWLLIRFSGTEPVLRLYSEGGNMTQVRQILNWAKDWAEAIA
ncbi:MAG: phosphoglucomutase/phosphomannomutase family protein [Cyanobacteria bacterium P01_H01_bin.15]